MEGTETRIPADARALMVDVAGPSHRNKPVFKTLWALTETAGEGSLDRVTPEMVAGKLTVTVSELVLKPLFCA